MTVFMERLQALMDEHNMTDNELKSECGISKNSITNWRNGVKPQRSMVEKLAHYFNVSPDYLTGFDDLKKEMLDMLDTPPDFSDPQIQTLAKYFSRCDAEGQFRIIHAAMTEFERCEAERKKVARRAVDELKSS